MNRGRRTTPERGACHGSWGLGRPASGDAFCAALVVSLLQGRERGEAPSLPTAAELEEILAR
jgi:hypothetical protein